MSERDSFHVVVIGGGPAGQEAALAAAEAGRRVLLVDREPGVGGECVNRGTIPSKTLRETAMHLASLKERLAGLQEVDLSQGVKLESLTRRLDSVRHHQHSTLRRQMEAAGIELVRGRAWFEDANHLCIEGVVAPRRRVHAELVVIATGSRPRNPAHVDVDHEHVLDSDSILSLIYLPSSLAILGAGVIACEFATIFAALGVDVTVVDHHDRPLGFLDRELAEAFAESFTRMGGTFLPGRAVESAAYDGFSRVDLCFEDGTHLRTEKALCALGRVAQLNGLRIENAGLAVDEGGHLAVDASCRTEVKSIYAVGDVIGPPALAASAREQGRRSMMHALGLGSPPLPESVPVGIYTIPEIATIGLSEAQAVERHGSVVVGRASIEETARGQINGAVDGLLKLVVAPDGRRLLGASVISEGATELIHLAQMALIAELDVDVFVENIFNFPTMSEAYRLAALDAISKRQELRRSA